MIAAKIMTSQVLWLRDWCLAGLTDLEVSTRELQAELAEKDKEAAALRAEASGLQEVGGREDDTSMSHRGKGLVG